MGTGLLLPSLTRGNKNHAHHKILNVANNVLWFTEPKETTTKKCLPMLTAVASGGEGISNTDFQSILLSTFQNLYNEHGHKKNNRIIIADNMVHNSRICLFSFPLCLLPKLSNVRSNTWTKS